jgi:phenylalanyl-tRNA synthetase alpha chain
MPGQRGPVPVPQPNGSRDLPTTVLETLEHTDPIQTSTTFPDVSQAEIKAAIDRLASRSMVEYDTTDSEIVVLTAEGKQIADEGSHEYKVWKVVKDSGRVSLKELPVGGICLKPACFRARIELTRSWNSKKSLPNLQRSARAMPSS